MSATTAPLPSVMPGADDLGPRTLLHLRAQIESARRLLGAVLSQGTAIRARKVDDVLGCMAEIKSEMDLRAHLEEDRTDLLVRAGQRLGVHAAGVTLDGMASLLTASEADEARTRSAELRGLLGEVAREHGVNRALMRQELSFLDHLVRLMGSDSEAGYRPDGPVSAPSSGPRALDLQA